MKPGLKPDSEPGKDSDRQPGPALPSRSSRWRPLLLIVVLAVLLVILAVQHTTPDWLAVLADRRDAWQSRFADAPLTTLALYALMTIATAAALLPVGAFAMIVAGAVFGLVTGVVVASFTLSLAATLTFVVVRRRLAPRLRSSTLWSAQRASIDRGVERNGAATLLSLRLLPIVPFGVVNVAMGLSPIRLATFHWIGQLGALPSVFVYVNAGTQLARIRQIGDVLSPGLLGAFVAVAILPWIMTVLLRRKPLGPHRDGSRNP